jgi:hypothetical protein
MHAHPFPWDVSLAFDRNPVTCWSAWQEIDRGAWIAVEFEQDEEIAAVALTTSPNESSARWQLEGKTDPASWFSLNASSKAESEAPLPDLRRAATQELKRNHIQYLWAEMDQRNDFQNHAREWGVRLIAESQGILLYQIE